MCGIVGYTGNRTCSKVLYKGLKNLEYRGYDSAGMAVQKNGDGSIDLIKRVGKLPNLEQALLEQDIDGTTGIAHTRWATHGKPSQENAHPHSDCSGKISIVHNGIIENYAELKDDLIKKGHTFTSETDSEVIIHLIEEKYEGDLERAVISAIDELDGAFAIVALSADEPDLLIGARKDSPLIVGVGENENFIASAVPAVLPYTKNVIYLEDKEIARVTPGKIRITDFSGNEIKRESTEVKWTEEAAEKGGYADFMLKEIHEQPAAVRDTLRGRSQKDGAASFDELNLTEEQIKGLKKIVFVACGTSYHAALVGKYVFEKWTKISTEVQVASEFRYSSPVLDDKTLIIAISQSGETADTLAGVRIAREQGSKVAAIVNVIGSLLSREADAVLYTHAGLEIGVAATKTFLAQLIAVYLTGLYLGIVRGTITRHYFDNQMKELNMLPEKIEEILTGEDRIKELAERFAESDNFLYLGRGVGFPVALEGALKLKEISYVHSEGYPAGEMKHGPIALLDKETPVMAIATEGAVKSKMISNIQEAIAREATCIAIINGDDTEVKNVAHHTISIPEVDELISPVLSTIPLQLFAYYLAKKRGCNVDQPRNLAKSVTVE